MKIMGNTVGTTMPRSDWAQTNPKAADYIRNKPDIPAMQQAIQAAKSSADAANTHTGMHPFLIGRHAA